MSGSKRDGNQTWPILSIPSGWDKTFEGKAFRWSGLIKPRETTAADICLGSLVALAVLGGVPANPLRYRGSKKKGRQIHDLTRPNG